MRIVVLWTVLLLSCGRFEHYLPKGETGEQGQDGRTGNIGGRGVDGERGQKGDPGNVGGAGPTGQVGDRGTDGRRGSDCRIETVTFEDTGTKTITISCGEGPEVIIDPHPEEDIVYLGTVCERVIVFIGGDPYIAHHGLTPLTENWYDAKGKCQLRYINDTLQQREED